MKHSLLLLLFYFVFAGTVFCQESDHYKKIQAVETQIDTYIAKNFDSVEIPEKDLQQFHKNIRLENEDGILPTKEKIQKSLAVYKKYLLRVAFFNKYPAKRKLYAPPSTK